MQISGELVGKHIIVSKSRDVGRLYSKNHFGRTTADNKLQLNLLEGAFLLGEGKIDIFEKKKKIDFQTLVTMAANHIPHFEIKYLVFRDIRKRGHAVQLSEKHKKIDFFNSNKEKPCFISVFSERDAVTINEIKELIKIATKNGNSLWFAIVDEEGDLTYYDVDSADLKGTIKKHVFSESTGILLENRVVIFDKQQAKNLLEKEFFGKPFGSGLQLSLVEALYLMEKDLVDVQCSDGKRLSTKAFTQLIKQSQPDIKSRMTVFRDLKKRRLIVKTGFKFGAHFRAYTKQPDETHAEYLIHVVDKGFTSTWAEISRAVRLAHSVNKEIIFARVNGETIDYIKLGRLRP